MAMKVSYTVVNGEILSENRNGAKRDYLPDPLGSTVALLDSSQNQTDTFSYWPYGELKSRTGSTSTPFRFVGTAGYYFDGGNISYVKARQFRLDLGNWLTPDPIGFRGGDANLYRYVSNQPTSSIDPTGTQAGLLCPKTTVIPRSPIGRISPSIERAIGDIDAKYFPNPRPGGKVGKPIYPITYPPAENDPCTFATDYCDHWCYRHAWRYIYRACRKKYPYHRDYCIKHTKTFVGCCAKWCDRAQESCLRGYPDGPWPGWFCSQGVEPPWEDPRIT